MRLKQSRYLRPMVECSVRAAVRKIGVVPPALSKSVCSLEPALHGPLIARTSRGVVLTHAGRAFHARARSAATGLRNAEEEAAQISHNAGGSVTFNMDPAGVMAVLPESAARFRRRFPLAPIRAMNSYGHSSRPTRPIAPSISPSVMRGPSRHG